MPENLAEKPAPAGDDAQKPRWSKLAVAAFVVSLPPFCLNNLVGLPLAFCALGLILAKRRRNLQRLRGSGLAAAAIIFDVFAILIHASIPMTPVAAISKQKEAKATLKEIVWSQHAHKKHHGAYATKFSQLAFRRDPCCHRYALLMGDDFLAETNTSVCNDVWCFPGSVNSAAVARCVRDYEAQHGKADGFRGFAAGVITNKPILDIWAIDETGRVESVFDAASLTWRDKVSSVLGTEPPVRPTCPIE